MKIEKMGKQHTEEAAKTLVYNYQQELKHVPSLPGIDFFDYFYNSINDIIQKHYSIVAVKNNKILGFLSGIPVNALKGLHRGIYCGINTHGAIGDKKDIYQRLYENISEIWVKNGCITHAIAIFAHDEPSVNTWFHLGFGNRCVDSMRSLIDIAEINENQCEIKLLTESDAEILFDLHSEHHKYYAKAPLFMPVLNKTTVDELKNKLLSKGKYTWAAFKNNKPIAMMSCRKGGEYPFIANEEKTINVFGAYTLEETRGTGVSVSLLNTIIRWARKNGFERLGVDYESFNRYGSRFWEKHFTPFVYCLFRKIDENILWANAERMNTILI